MLTELRLKNFKAWKDTEKVSLQPVTMLLGTNSSGKSSLIQSLLLLKQTAQSPDRSIHLNLGGDEVNDLFNFGDFDSVLTAAEGVPRRFEIAFRFIRPPGERVTEGSFMCSYGQASSGAVVVQELELGTAQRRFRSIRREKGAFSLLVDDDPREPWFMSYSHDATVIGATLDIVEDAVKVVFGGKKPLRKAA